MTAQTKKGPCIGTAQVLGGNAHEGRSGNVLSGEISVAAAQKMMLQSRKVKRVNLVGALGLTYCHIKSFARCCIAATGAISLPERRLVAARFILPGGLSRCVADPSLLNSPAFGPGTEHS
jgi:hypothetical protein